MEDVDNGVDGAEDAGVAWRDGMAGWPLELIKKFNLFNFEWCAESEVT